MTAAAAADLPYLDARHYRRVLGEFCTGVTVVTSADENGPVGFACQSFSALSLDPPLVLFCPAKGSGTWAAISRIGRFCVNVLSSDQQPISELFGRPAADRFEQVEWSASPGSMPVITGVTAWIDCELVIAHDAGDHAIVVGRVTAMCGRGSGRPLLFHRGRYTATERLRAVDVDYLQSLASGSAWL